mmetsp:Transcript_49128/g.72998  ORF Transcript_49128/g.72998 Transcript_49128/m.72998 type:complete len:486 (+) Transcript_49128:53-1510(+)|eukprot:CAMPEP_0195524976 /NCGR_PEP_ID=MMETSP0794_2-20130614/25126_1 /TAXON_ID=515487 /ORGANISM="Stephanopyxis turris, Strain CCMP 815" /LENGTH=485 /DNA_ID=CAMNT_0040655327 /DNA_START=49 /DNA_END=1506 /DNA_ORIENTATION=+
MGNEGKKSPSRNIATTGELSSFTSTTAAPLGSQVVAVAPAEVIAGENATSYPGDRTLAYSQAAVIAAAISAKRSSMGTFSSAVVAAERFAKNKSPIVIPSIAVATAGAARHRRIADTTTIRRQKRASTLISKLLANDPSLMSLKLYKRPDSYYNDFSEFLNAIEGNKSITSVNITWIFLSALTESQRIRLMKQVGVLPSIIDLQLEGIGPSTALRAALSGCRERLEYLRIGSLRISGGEDVKELAIELEQNRSLQGVFLSNVRVKVEGRYRFEQAGRVLFEEINHHVGARSLITIDPILTSLAAIPTLSKIELHLQLDGSKIARIDDKIVQTLCQSRTHLMLHSCNLDDQHCSTIARELEGQNSTMKVMSISLNHQISAHGWNTIANVLEKNYCLRHFYTDWGENDNPTTHYALPRYLSDCASVPNDAYRAKMDMYLKLNRAGRGKLLMGNGDFHKEWVDLFVLERDDIDVLFHMLRLNPPLCLV